MGGAQALCIARPGYGCCCCCCCCCCCRCTGDRGSTLSASRDGASRCRRDTCNRQPPTANRRPPTASQMHTLQRQRHGAHTSTRRIVPTAKKIFFLRDHWCAKCPRSTTHQCHLTANRLSTAKPGVSSKEIFSSLKAMRRWGGNGEAEGNIGALWCTTLIQRGLVTCFRQRGRCVVDGCHWPKPWPENVPHAPFPMA